MRPKFACTVFLTKEMNTIFQFTKQSVQNLRKRFIMKFFLAHALLSDLQKLDLSSISFDGHFRVDVYGSETSFLFIYLFFLG